MRAEHLVRYDTAGKPHLVVTSLDSPFVVSAYVEHASHNGWHFAYTRDSQREIAELIDGGHELRRALLFVSPEAADPGEEGGLPGRHLDLIVEQSRGWAVFHTGTREARMPLSLLTVDEHNGVPRAVRFGKRVVYADRPFLPAEQIRAAGVEYIRTGEMPETVGGSVHRVSRRRVRSAAGWLLRRICRRGLTGPFPSGPNSGRSTHLHCR